MTTKFRYIKQEERFGCVVACIAMLTNKTYIQVSKEFANNYNKHALALNKYFNYLTDEGYNIIWKEAIHTNHKKDSRERKIMCTPFADWHLVSVQLFADGIHHCVLMDSKGKVYDPDPDIKCLRSLNIYYDVLGVVGLIKRFV